MKRRDLLAGAAALPFMAVLANPAQAEAMGRP